MTKSDPVIERLAERFEEIIQAEDASNEQAGLALLMKALLYLQDDGFSQRGAMKYIAEMWAMLEAAPD